MRCAGVTAAALDALVVGVLAVVVVKAAAAVTVAKEKRGRLLCCFCLEFEHRLGDWIHFFHH